MKIETKNIVNDHEKQVRQELKKFNEQTNVHDLPDIFFYWGNTHLKPILGEFGLSNPDDLFSIHMLESALSCNVEKPLFASLGSGNCDTEVRVAKLLKDNGLQDFCIECIELNPNMLKRGYDSARKEGVSDYLSFVKSDLNQWKAAKTYTSVIANQSLHHVKNLEGLFEEIKFSLTDEGAFIVSDMIGKNGHQRWPEAYDAVKRFWHELPDEYKYNHQLKRYEDVYENWDCSTEGFEGIRSQDILPLLVENFNFHLFVGFSNVIDIFIDRGFGPNFNVNNKWDTDFIDRVHFFDENSIRNGTIKPTHIMASMKKNPMQNANYSRGYSPEYCIRDTKIEDKMDR